MDYTTILKQLEDEAKSLQVKIDSINTAIRTIKSAYGSESIAPTTSPVTNNHVIDITVTGSDLEYNKLNSFKTKFLYLLKKKGRFLHINEAVEAGVELEPNGSYYALSTGLRGAKSTLIKEGKIIKVQAGKSNVNTFYGLKSWLTESGDIKEGYEYDEERVAFKQELDTDFA